MFVPFGSGYIFQLVEKNEEPKDSISNYCIINSKNGKISGCFSYELLNKDPNFSELWKKAQTFKKNINHSIWSYNYTNDVLCHHGIKGQEWGVTNGPPYPLDSKVHNKVVKQGKLKKKYDKTVEKGQVLRDATSQLESLAKVNVKKSLKLNSKRIAASIKLSEVVLSPISRHKVFSEDDPPKAIKGPHTIDDDLRDVNPMFDRMQYHGGTTNNCVNCSFTYDLRRRGYDVTAKANASGLVTHRVMKDLYEDAKEDAIFGKDWPDVFATMSELYPNNSRGVMSLYGKDNAAHAVSFEIKNGKCIVLDGQINDRHTAASLELSGDYIPGFVRAIRTDNLKVKLENIHMVCNELKDSWQKEASWHHSDWNKKGRGAEPSLDEIGKMLGIDFDDDSVISKYKID